MRNSTPFVSSARSKACFTWIGVGTRTRGASAFPLTTISPSSIRFASARRKAARPTPRISRPMRACQRTISCPPADGSFSRFCAGVHFFPSRDVTSRALPTAKSSFRT